MVELKCYCGTIFGRESKEVRKARRRGQQDFYCSHGCANSVIARRRAEKRIVEKSVHCKQCYSLFVPHSGSAGSYCSSKCQQDFQYSSYIKRWLVGLETGNTSNGSSVSAHVRRYLFESCNSKCQQCGWSKVNPFTSLVPLNVHHINGNALDSGKANLELLCPNCHALTENYGNRNKSVRVYRYKSKGQ
jgi:hypothetical protein